MSAAPRQQPRAIGSVTVTVKSRQGGSALDRLRQSGSLKALFPRTADRGVQAVLVNTAGGITGGDAFAVNAQAGDGAALTLTTQAAERAYRAQPGETGRLDVRLFAGAGARLDWLPQETILYEGCSLNRTLTAELADDASLLLVEPLVFGRVSAGEVLRAARFRDRIEIRRAGTPVYLDAMRFDGDLDRQLARPHVGAGARALATLVMAAPEAGTYLSRVRALLPETAGASLIRDDLLAARFLAPDSHALRRSLVPVLNLLTRDTLPRPWMI